MSAAVDTVRPIGIFPNIRIANAVSVGVRANIVTRPGADSTAVNTALKTAFEQRVAGLGFGDAVLASEVIRDFMNVTGVVDVQNLHLRRYPPAFGSIIFGDREQFQDAVIEADLAANLALSPDEIATFRVRLAARRPAGGWTMSAMGTLSSRWTLPYARGAEFAKIALGPDAGGATEIPPYDFREYRARWGADPSAPAYVIAPLNDLIGDDYLITIGYTWNQQDLTTTLTAPNGTRGGSGFCIPLPVGADASLRLTSFSVAPKLPGSGANSWEIFALLGTTAKLTWILSTGKEEIARVRSDVRNLRFVDSAFGAGLDELGADMRVPRFPPRPYSLDDKTIALWHLDELPNGGLVTQVVDQSAAAHVGTVNKAAAGAAGKFATGFSFPATGAAIVVAASPSFDIAQTANATVEAFVAAIVPTDSTPRVVLARRKTETSTGSPTTPGWSLSIVNARGFDANVLFAASDGTREVRVFADLSVADGAFHHIAGVIDRKRSRVRVFVDGVQRATAPIDGLGAIAPPDDLRFGSTTDGVNLGNLFNGVIDEVRISNVARASFFPVLGEEDDAYRARLRIFRRWTLPSLANLRNLINEAAPFPNDPAPYVLIDKNQATQVALRPVRIVPQKLAIGQAIAVDGSIARDETVAGTPNDDAGFDPTLDLITYSNGKVDFTGDPGGGRMQAGVGKLLVALVARLTALPATGNLVIEHSFDATGAPTPLHAVGRALRLRHATVDAGTLGALAHRAGFTYALNLGPDIAVAVAAGERLAIRGGPAATARADMGSPFDLTVDPPLPLAGIFTWTIVTPGPAAAHFEPPTPPTLATSAATAAGAAVLQFASVPAAIISGMGVADMTTGAAIPAGTTVISTTATTVVLNKNVAAPGVSAADKIQFTDLSKTPLTTRPRLRFVTNGAGDLAVRVEYARGSRTRSGTLSLRVDPVTLMDGHAMDTVYNADPDMASIVGLPDAGFDASYLVTHAPQPSIDFGTDPNNMKMQVATRDALDALVALLAARNVTGRLKVTQAYAPSTKGVESVGRGLVLGHETLDAGALARSRRGSSTMSAAPTQRSRPMCARTRGLRSATPRSGPPARRNRAGNAAGLAPAPGTLGAGTYNWSTARDRRRRRLLRYAAGGEGELHADRQRRARSRLDLCRGRRHARAALQLRDRAQSDFSTFRA